jgi:putative redox protein
MSGDAGPIVETMSVSVASGPGFHSEAVPAGYDGRFTLIGAEPVAEGGSGKGPNPMQILMAALVVCEHEESQVVAESVLGAGAQEWKKCNWRTEFDVNLAGYEGKAGDASPLPAKDIFRKVFISGNAPGFKGTAGKLEELRQAIFATCPVTRLFDACGVAWSETIAAAAASEHAENAALDAELQSDLTFRMTVDVQGDGFHSDVAVPDDDDVTHRFALAEPEDEGGSGKGPNPMEALISSLAICEFEQSLVIAKERGVKQWEVKQELTFEVNLDGYMNKAKNMAAKDVFRNVSRTGKVATEADASVVDSILEATKVRCPITRLFADAGVAMEGQWVKA